MASTDAVPVPRKNTAFRVTFPLYDADGDLVTGATGLDSEVSKDAGTFADCTNEATEIATSSGVYYLDLTSTEMNADTVAVIVKSSAKTLPLVFYPEEAGDIRTDTVKWNGTAVATPSVAGVPEVDITHIDGLATAANNATLNLKQLNIVNSAGDAIVASATGSNGKGINASGNGTGEGILATGGATGAGIKGAGGATSGDGILGSAAAGNSQGIKGAGQGSGAGGLFVGGATGHGLKGLGGATSGDGIKGEAQGASNAGFKGAGGGSSFGLDATFSTGAITAGTFAAGAIDAAAIGADAIGASEIAASAIGASEVATDAIGAAEFAADTVDEILDDVVEGAHTFRQYMRVFMAFIAGKTAGGGTTSIAYRDQADTKNRITQVVDSDGDRSATTIDGS